MANPKNVNKNFFGIFINLLGLISAVLYFCGWIYRLAYYQRFNISITELDFSFESFLLIPVCTLFSDLLRLVLYKGPFNLLALTLLAFLVVLGLFISFKYIKLFWKKLERGVFSKFSSSFLAKALRRFQDFFVEYKILQTCTIIFTLFLVFSFAWVKGFIDGSRDLNDSTSILPEVSLVSSTNVIKNSQVLGNTALAKQVLNSTMSSLSQKWRLLLRQGDWIYLVATVPPGSKSSPKVLALTKGEAGDKLLILQP